VNTGCSPADAKLLAAYLACYGLDDGAVGIDEVRRHLDLERRLTEQLLATTADQRWSVFEQCYSTIYAELPWLVDVGSTIDDDRWARLIGPPPKRIYEVGSGHGELARALARRGYDVTATDISRARGGDRAAAPRLAWGVTDGVHLAQFAAPASVDAVITSQVIEHLHPDDVREHFRGAFALLRPGGRYVFATPHALTGPHDVSQVVGADHPFGMHLREYDVATLVEMARTAGFGRIRSVATLPRLPRWTRTSSVHLRYLLAIESRRAMHQPRVRALLRRLKPPLRPDAWLVAEMP
jgi:SAM-dependent methyltransferase